MLPLRDNIPSRRFPIVTIALIGINALVFLHELTLGKDLPYFFSLYSVIPARLTANAFSLETLRTLVTAQFLHGGWMHLIGNMLFLYIFGDNVEDWFGHVPYLLFYLFCGVVSFLTQILVTPMASIPTLGASGAVAGVLGAYFLLYPSAKILTLIPFFIFIQFVEIPALIFLGVWFLFQFLQGSIGYSGTGGGIAFWAHIGGFITGMGIVLLRLPTRRRR